MLSEVQIVTGAEGRPWSRKERECVLEIRSEHKLDDPTSFSLLMHHLPRRPREESPASALPVAGGGQARPELAVGHKMAVLARPAREGDWTVLFQGKITEIETDETQGGLGSTKLYKGVDIRTIMAGRHFRGSWSGRMDDVMKHIIELDFPDPIVDAPDQNELVEEENPLAQNANNLDFLRAQALAVGHSLWVSYAVVPDAAAGVTLPSAGPAPTSVTVTPTIYWARSPIINEMIGRATNQAANALGALVGGATGAGIAGALSVPVGDQGGPIPFKVHLSGRSCPNVTTFEVTSDGQEVAAMPSDPEGPSAPLNVPPPPENPAAAAPDADAPVVYFKPPTTQANEEDEAVNQALEIAQRFKVEVKLSTTKRMLQRLVLSHELAELIGVDEPLAGKLFRIKEVTHVIRADNHYMDVVLDGDGETATTATGNALPAPLGAIP